MGTGALGGTLTSDESAGSAPSGTDSGAPHERRLGIFGGTFDPVHLGHLVIAEHARDVLGLHRVVFVPAAVPPHRAAPTGASAEQRATMVERAIAGNPAFEVDRVELERPGPSFSADTLAIFARREREAGREPDLWFILSTEALRGLPSWRDPARILELARLAVVPRPGTAIPDPTWLEQRFAGCSDRVVLLDGPLLAISATEVRARVAAGRSIRYLVPDAVRAQIADDALYRP